MPQPHLVAIAALVSWYLLVSAWVYAQAAGAERGYIPRPWALLLVVDLTVAPFLVSAVGWVQVALAVPVALSGLLAWPMALRAEQALNRHATPPPPATRRRSSGRSERLSTLDTHLNERVRRAMEHRHEPLPGPRGH